MKSLLPLKSLIFTVIILPLFAFAQFPGTDVIGEYYMVQFGAEYDSYDQMYYTSNEFIEISILDGDSGYFNILYSAGGYADSGYFSYTIDDSNNFVIIDSGEVVLRGLFAQDGNSFNGFSSDTSNFRIAYGIRKSTGKTSADFFGEYFGGEMSIRPAYCKGGCGNEGGASFSRMVADGAGNMTVYVENSNGELDTVQVTYTVDPDGLFEIYDPEAEETIFVGVLSPDGDYVADVWLTDQAGISFGVKKSSAMEMTDVAPEFFYVDFSFEDNEGEFMEGTENKITLQSTDSSGMYYQLSKSGDGELESGPFNWIVDSDGLLTLFADSQWIANGAMTTAGDKFFLLTMEDGYISLGIGVAKPVTPDAIGDDDLNQVRSFSLEANYPNPFNPTTTINYKIDKPGQVELTIYNTLGQKVKVLVAKTLSTGLYRVEWDGLDNNNHAVSSGIYFYQLKTESGAITKKMTLIR